MLHVEKKVAQIIAKIGISINKKYEFTHTADISIQILPTYGKIIKIYTYHHTESLAKISG